MERQVSPHPQLRSGASSVPASTEPLRVSPRPVTRAGSSAAPSQLHNHDDHGDKVKPTEQHAKSRFTPKSGLFAMLGGARHVNGSGAPATARAGFRLAALLALGALLSLTLGVCTALASTAHEFGSAFGPDGTDASHFEAPGPVAVDQETHDVYVADQGGGTQGAGTVHKFDQNGTPVEFTAGSGKGSDVIGGFFYFSEEAQNQIAVDNSCWQHSPRLTELTTPSCKEFDPSNGDFYVAAYNPFEPGANSIKIFQRNGETAGEIGGLELVFGVAIDANGDVYAGEREAGVVRIFQPNHEEITSFQVSNASNLAVDSAGSVYVAPYPFSGLPVKKFTPSTFPVTPSSTYSGAGAVDPNRAFGLAIDPSNDDLYVDEHDQIVQFSKDGTLLGGFAKEGVGALTASEGVAVDATTEDVYASDIQSEISDIHSERQVEIFVPPPPNPPVVGSSSFSDVIATSADVQTQVDPEHFDTHYRFQYVTQAQFQASGFSGAAETSEADLGSTGEPRSARAHLGGLEPDTTYRFRVLARNANGEALSAEPAASFTTFPAVSPGLPDGRVYEMVSPPQKVGEVFAPNGYGGSCRECLPGLSKQFMPMQSAPDGESVVYEGQPFAPNLASGEDEYLARRSSNGWETAGLSSPLFNGNAGQGYVGFSRELSRGVLYQSEPALSATAPTREGTSYANLYLRDDDGSLQPLVTVAPPHRAPGTPQGFDNGFRIVYAGANAGTTSAPPFDHLIFEANDALTEAVPGIAPSAPEIDEGEAGTQCSFRGARCDLYEWFEGQLRLVNVLPGNNEAVAGAMFGSGRLIETREHEGEEPPVVDNAISSDGSRVFWSDAAGQLYVRIDGRETQKIEDPGKFITASADGSRVLLNDGCLYDLRLKTCQNLAPGQGEKFIGILGAAQDLSRVYFVDTAVLTGGEENSNHEQAEGERDNLYAWDEGATKFIGKLVGDGKTGAETGDFSAWKAGRPIRQAQVSPDGSFLAFVSRAPLTGYDNIPSGGGECRFGEAAKACPEVFEYAASAARLTCASCNPTGHQPLGGSNLSLIRTTLGLNAPLPQPGNLSAEGHGRLFFESQDTLSTQDTNGHIQDVYEWEPSGTGSCKRAAGCVSLISSGHSDNDSMFVDSTPSGNDAFFITREQLLSQDKNEQLDLYDARVDGGIAAGETAPCAGEACRPPAGGPPPSQPPASSVFNGPGNLVPSIPSTRHAAKPKPPTRAQKLAKALRACAKKPKKKRGACRIQAKKRFGPAKATAKTKSHTGGK